FFLLSLLDALPICRAAQRLLVHCAATPVAALSGCPSLASRRTDQHAQNLFGVKTGPRHESDTACMTDTSSPNQALQRTAFGIKCSAAGGRAKSAHERWRARVLMRRRAVAELSSYAA